MEVGKPWEAHRPSDGQGGASSLSLVFLRRWKGRAFRHWVSGNPARTGFVSGKVAALW